MKIQKVLTTIVTGLLFLFCAAGAIAENCSIDGSGNNLVHYDWGKTGSTLRRADGAAYSDGISEPAGQNRPSPRLISNTVLGQDESIPNIFGRSDYIWAWGQFIDHDLDLVETAVPFEPFDIIVPPGDEIFDPDASGGVFLPFNRSAYDPCTGTDASNPRQQVNILTSWLDASMVYGSDPCRAAWLREGSGGRLKVTSHAYGALLPYNDGTVPNAGGTGTDLFVAGDVRANEHAILTSLHTLFVREHNRLAGKIALANQGWSDEQIYQKARKIMGAEIQVITFKEFLPALLREDAPSPYSGYKPQVDGTIANVFATAAYRFGHSALSPKILRLDENLNEIPYGHIDFEEAFFNPSLITEEGGIEPILRGLAYQFHQEIDIFVIDAVRNSLFTTLDLTSLNIQRGRDHGLPDYNKLRELHGLEAITDFDEINSEPKIWTGLQAVYGNVNNIDPWVGMIAEGSTPSGLRHTVIKGSSKNCVTATVSGTASMTGLPQRICSFSEICGSRML